MYKCNKRKIKSYIVKCNLIENWLENGDYFTHLFNKYFVISYVLNAVLYAEVKKVASLWKERSEESLKSKTYITSTVS